MRMTGNARQDARNILLYVLENNGILHERDLRKACPYDQQYVSKLLEKLRGQKILKLNGSTGFEIELDQATGKNYLSPDDVKLYKGK